MTLNAAILETLAEGAVLLLALLPVFLIAWWERRK